MMVDAVCIGSVTGMVLWQSVPLYYVLIYNFLAFAMQPLFGIIADHKSKPVYIAVLGCCLVLLGVILDWSLISIVLLGTGNALFHIGGGIFSLNLAPDKSAYPGIFVAPGALGVFAGSILARTQSPIIGLLSLVLLLCTLILFFMRNSVLQKTTIQEDKFQGFKVEFFVMILLLLTISFRSLVGMMFHFEWKSNLYLAFILTLGVVLGKAFGGILADSFGSLKVGVGGLVASSILLTLFSSNWILASVGVFAFNFTMPITLSLLARTMGKYKGFAFGLTTLALFIGYFIFYMGYQMNNAVILLSILGSALLLTLAVRRLKSDDHNSVHSCATFNSSH